MTAGAVLPPEDDDLYATHHDDAPATTTCVDLVHSPLVLTAGDQLVLTASVRGHELRKWVTATGPGYVRTITVNVTMAGDTNIIAHTNRVLIGWRAIEEIARYVAGDGTDPLRMALADGIREGRREP